MRFIHIADVHYGMVPDKGKPWSDIRAREIKDTFREVIDIAEEKHIDLLLIAGDLFHSPPTTAMLKEVDYMLSKLSRTKTIIIAGNHDYMDEDSPYSQFQFESRTVCLPSNEPTSVYIDDCDCYISGYSYNAKEITEPIYDNIIPEDTKRINFLLAHGGDPKHAPMDFEKINNAGFDYIALGHIHKPQVIYENRMNYCGSLEPIDCNEEGERGYIYGEVRDGRVTTEFVRLCKRTYENIEIAVKSEYTNEEIMDNIIDAIIKRGKQNIFTIKLTGRRADIIEIDSNTLRRRYHIYDIIDEVDSDYDTYNLMINNEDNLLGRFIGEYYEKQSDEVSRKAMQYGIEAILSSGKR